MGGWTQWWEHRDQHRTDAILANTELHLTDTLAVSDPKTFFKMATGPLTVTDMGALQVKGKIVTDDAGIEDACVGALHHIGGDGPEEQIEPDPGQVDSRLDGMMDSVKLEQMLTAASC